MERRETTTARELPLATNTATRLANLINRLQNRAGLATAYTTDSRLLSIVNFWPARDLNEVV